MPKCEFDPILHERILQFVREGGLTPNAAATKLGVDRTTFWRFCDSGRARNDTKTLYIEALEKCNSKVKDVVAYDAVKTDEAIARALTTFQGSLAGDELKLLRRACESVLLLLDAYEAKPAGTDI